MNIKRASETGLLLSGGLDSCILLAHLLDAGHTVRPIYIRTGVAWQAEESGGVRRFLGAVRSPQLRDLVSFELPLDDLYGNHWSMTGLDVPTLGTSDESVYLPGRNPLLLIKAAVWCQTHGIEELALATLASNPFADATADFFAAFERAITLAGSSPLRITRPFATRSKREVMELGRDYPLAHTFSCIAPHDGLHCGECNKCGERKAAFKTAGLTDPTPYATHNASISPQPLLTPDS